MFRLFKDSFNRKSIVSGGMQVVNLVAFGGAAYNLLTNPEASVAEFGLDMLVHGVSYFALSDTANLLTTTGSSFINTVRLGAIYAGMTTLGCSEVPGAALAVDAVLHLSNTVVPLLNEPAPERTRGMAPQ
ncbi:hypothetical protein [Legionella brunensis]|uniref:Uncharacterized protein n=1 Tax=Legionella brunensis TaxID=29422 RepID=A0A0W0SDS8_9GAMM|nr:hypothetical protein [Legionella brunensis]KTC81628.1 hypothetical protein Lbru_2148 [Legionella brunensis]